MTSSIISYAQEVEVKNNNFIRVYDLKGKKIIKGKVVRVSDTLLKLKSNGKITSINFNNIGYIKTKRSAGHNILIGSAIGTATGAIFGAATDPYAWFADTTDQAAFLGGIYGAMTGAAVGGITVLLKKSKVFIINGNESNWLMFIETIKE